MVSVIQYFQKRKCTNGKQHTYDDITKLVQKYAIYQNAQER